MKNKKVIQFAIILLAVAGVSYFIYTQKNKMVKPREVALSYLSDEAIANSLHAPVPIIRNSNGCFIKPADEAGTYGICSVSRGDLNNDGYIDAAGILTHCGATCGVEIVTIINNKDGTGTMRSLNTDSIVSSSGGQTGLYSLSIINGNIAVLGSGFNINGSQKNSVTYVRYRVDGNNLVLIDWK